MESLLISIGSILCALAINGILIPKGFYGAGFTGIALLVHYMAPAFPVSLVYLAINIPVFGIGWIYVGRHFFYYSIAGMLIFTAAVEWIHFPIPVNEQILCALLAGILMGTGSGSS